MTYVYESHLGGLYTSDYELDYDDLYCEQCGDSDSLFAVVDETNKNDVLELIEELCFDWKYARDIEYIKEFIQENFYEVDIIFPQEDLLPNREWIAKDEYYHQCTYFMNQCEDYSDFSDDPDCQLCSLNWNYELGELNI